MIEGEFLEQFGMGSLLREDEFQLLAGAKSEFGAGLWTDADPVDLSGSRSCTVCLDSDFKSRCMQGFDKRVVQLQERFSTRADDQLGLGRWCVCGPALTDRFGKVGCGREASTTLAVRSYEVSVAEAANRS